MPNIDSLKLQPLPFTYGIDLGTMIMDLPTLNPVHPSTYEATSGGGLPISALALLGGGLLGGMGYLSDITGIGASPYSRALSGISLGNLPDPQQFISSMAAVAGARGAESQIALQSRLANMGALPGGATAALSQKARSESDVEYLKIQPEIIRQATELAQLRANLELQKAMGKSQSGIFGDILGGAQTAANILSALKLVGLL